LVLGTIEPRKNAGQVLRFIKEHPGFLKQHKFVFLGRFGWGTTIEEQISHFGVGDAYSSGRIVFPGFVSDYVKCLLLRDAELVIYPSLFEGFGLPLLEAAPRVRLVVASE
jgi:glycosyltransferase involved in cell wall biosynthesis